MANEVTNMQNSGNVAGLLMRSFASAGFVRCTVIRDRSRLRKMYPQYQLLLEDTDKVVMVAQKQVQPC